MTAMTSQRRAVVILVVLVRQGVTSITRRSTCGYLDTAILDAADKLLTAHVVYSANHFAVTLRPALG